MRRRLVLSQQVVVSVLSSSVTETFLLRTVKKPLSYVQKALNRADSRGSQSIFIGNGGDDRHHPF